MSFDGLQERLGALQATISQVKDPIHRLRDPEPPLASSASSTAAEDESAAGGLGAEVVQLLREAQDERRKLEEEVELLDSLGGHERSRLQEGLDRAGSELERCRADFRSAKLSARKQSARALRQERQHYVQSFTLADTSTDPSDGDPTDNTSSTNPHYTRHHHHAQKPSQHQQLSSLSEKDRQTVGASSRATEALRMMHASLQSELERSEYANETMAESSAAFGRLSESYSSLEVMLGSSRDLLGTLLRSQKSDTWYLRTSLYMLVGTLSWLVFRRFLYGPLWLFVWLPLRFLFGVGSKVGQVAFKEKGGEGEKGRPGAGGDTGTVSVEGLPGKDLPTAKVGQDTGEIADEPGSMAEEVGKIIDRVHEADQEGLIPEVPADEEDQVIHDGQGAQDTRPRDEL